jgi:hypothetical protein
MAKKIHALAILKGALSAEATIHTAADAEYPLSSKRWSDFAAPTPWAVVNVATEADVQVTASHPYSFTNLIQLRLYKQVQWATKHAVPFVAQSGGHGCSSWYKIGSDGIVINMRKLNSVQVDREMGSAVIGGGALVQELLTAAKEKKAHIGKLSLP